MTYLVSSSDRTSWNPALVLCFDTPHVLELEMKIVIESRVVIESPLGIDGYQGLDQLHLPRQKFTH